MDYKNISTETAREIEDKIIEIIKSYKMAYGDIYNLLKFNILDRFEDMVVSDKTEFADNKE